MQLGQSPHLRTPFALKNGRMVLPADVDSGLECGCTCVGCGARLIAKKGVKLVWHFAHHIELATESCVETAIHAAAKQVLLENNWLRVPSKVVTVTGRAKFGATCSRSRTLAEARTIRFDHSRDEVWEAGANVRPDVVGYRGPRRLLVEMCFRHAVDEVKRLKLVSLGLPAVEIDLADIPLDASFDAVRERVLNDLSHKEWLFHPGEEEASAELLLEVQRDIEAFEQEYDANVALGRRKEEARLREKARVRQTIADANEAYRLLPSSEKERQVRETLRITGAWPYYLNKPSPEASAVDAPARLWQAALFARFVFGKAKHSRAIEVDTLAEWVSGRFGVLDNRFTDVETAVRKFLSYLRACGFLEKSPYNPYQAPNYVVIHSELQPPPRQAKKEPTKIVTSSAGRADVSQPPRAPRWLWRASWPPRDEIMEISAKLLGDSAHKQVLDDIVQNLTRRNCPDEPVMLARMVEAHGVPAETTLDFLVRLGVALRSRGTPGTKEPNGQSRDSNDGPPAPQMWTCRGSSVR